MNKTLQGARNSLQEAMRAVTCRRCTVAGTFVALLLTARHVVTGGQFTISTDAQSTRALSRASCVNPEEQRCPGMLSSRKCRGDIDMIWSLGFARGPDPFNLTIRGPIQTGQDAVDFGDRVLFVADPFLIINESRWFVFSEALNSECQKGEIAFHVSRDEGLTWSYGGIVLAESWHLSFPFIVSNRGAFYMVTCATAGTRAPYSLWLYTTRSLPSGWQRVGEILQNQTIGRPLDPVLYNFGGFWYLFVLDDGVDKQRLFYYK